MWSKLSLLSFFFFNDTATTEIYTLSLHDALPILLARPSRAWCAFGSDIAGFSPMRSEEHTSELSHDQISYAVFCLKKKILCCGISHAAFRKVCNTFPSLSSSGC